MCNCLARLCDSDTLVFIVLILAILLVCDNCNGREHNHGCC